METFERLVTIASGLTVIVTLIVLFSKNGGEIYKRLCQKRDEEEDQKKDLSEIKESLKSIEHKISVLEETEK